MPELCSRAKKQSQLHFSDNFLSSVICLLLWSTDDCAEDNYAPVISMSRAEEFCGGDKHVFANEAEARDCLNKHIVVTDDCYPVTKSLSSVAVSSQTLSQCGTTHVATITAEEDDSIKKCNVKKSSASIKVLVDGYVKSSSSNPGACEFLNGPDFPPSLDVSMARELCARNIFFQTAQEAENCVLKHSVASDDCRDVEIDVTSSEPDTGKLSACAKTFEITVRKVAYLFLSNKRLFI